MVRSHFDDSDGRFLTLMDLQDFKLGLVTTQLQHRKILREQLVASSTALTRAECTLLTLYTQARHSSRCCLFPSSLTLTWSIKYENVVSVKVAITLPSR